MALNLDIDLVRGQLGGWLDQPADAGLAARAIAISMINTHLGSGYDVVVPQLLAHPDFIEQLEETAVAAGAKIRSQRSTTPFSFCSRRAPDVIGSKLLAETSTTL